MSKSIRKHASTDPERNRRGVISLRISKDEAGDEVAIQRHLRKAERIAARLRIEVDPAHVFLDNDATGFKATKRRKGWDEAMAVLRRGRHGHLITTAVDRLTREDLRVCEDLIDFFRGHEVIVHTDEDDYDLETVNGRKRFRDAAVAARTESERISQRTQDLHADMRTLGKVNGGTSPYGWRRVGHKPTYKGEADERGFVQEPAEAKVVREAIERVARGETITRIAQDLNRRGVPNRGGSRWNSTNLRRTVVNGIHAGLRFHDGEELGRADYIDRPIVAESVWRTAHRTLNDPARTGGRRRSARRYLLSGGLLRCGECGEQLYSKPQGAKGRSYRTYVCSPSTDVNHPGCGGVSVRADHVERAVARSVVAYIESAAFAKALAAHDGSDASIAAEVADIEDEMAAFEELYASGAKDDNGRRLVTIDEWNRVRPRQQARLAEARGRLASDTKLAAVGAYAGQRGAFTKAWAEHDDDLDWRQAAVRSVLDHVVVAKHVKGSAPRFDPARLSDPVWRA